MGIDPSAIKRPADLSKVALSNSLKEVAKRDAAFSLEWCQTKAAEQLEYPILTKLVIMGRGVIGSQKCLAPPGSVFSFLLCQL